MSTVNVKGQALTIDNWITLLQDPTLERDDLQNTLGDVNKVKKWIEKVEKFLKEKLPTKFDSTEWEYGTGRYLMKRTEQVRVGLDGDKVKAEKLEELGGNEEAFNIWLKEHSKETVYYQINITELDEKPVATVGDGEAS